ncbi:MAG: hypothetical protein GY914_05370 [Prochlorococcus sp.]|nr:hypothetical protein [Prochlorococcus sp.]
MTRELDPFRIPQAGLEVAAMAGLFSIDANLNGGAFNGGEFVAESTLGGVAIYAVYQALLTGLRTEALLQRGAISRAVQLQMISATVWESVKQGAAVSLVLGVILLVCPWLSLPLSLLGLVGMGKASLDLFNAFWDGLDESQHAELLAASLEAGVNLRRFLNGDQSAHWASAQ